MLTPPKIELALDEQHADSDWKTLSGYRFYIPNIPISQCTELSIMVLSQGKIF